MFKLLKQYKDASSKTKYFALNWLIYGLALIITTVYCYARLDFVRSYRTPASIQAKKKVEDSQNAADSKNDIKDSKEKLKKNP